MVFLQKLAATGLSILIITHDLYLAIEYTSRSLLLANGKLIADKDPASVLADDEIIKLAGLHELSPISIAKKLGLNPKLFLNKFLAYREG
jgi:energy-coupling factor transport system ATP-binding protein